MSDSGVELLAPAGNFEKLEIAIHYGADAVYVSGRQFSLRNLSKNFSFTELQQAVRFCHRQGKKIYLAANIYPRNFELPAIRDYLERVGNLNMDAIIIADPGILDLAREIIPHVPVHLSTQANTTSVGAVKFWEKFGIKRVNIARELTLKEIREIFENTGVEIEAFVHGSMCIAYSGRCLLSAFMANRESNRGMCCHPCRFKYTVMEETRPGQYFPVLEDGSGTFIFNSRDLCMIDHIPDMITAGITSLKIEGRMKGINYLASVVKTYRQAIDAWYHDPQNYSTELEWRNELAKTNYRGYCTGFYFGDPAQIIPNYRHCKDDHAYQMAGKVIGIENSQHIIIDVRNKLIVGDDIEIVTRNGAPENAKIDIILNEKREMVHHVQPGSKAILKLDVECEKNDIIRKINKLSDETESPRPC